MLPRTNTQARHDLDAALLRNLGRLVLVRAAERADTIAGVLERAAKVLPAHASLSASFDTAHVACNVVLDSVHVGGLAAGVCLGIRRAGKVGCQDTPAPFVGARYTAGGQLCADEPYEARSEHGISGVEELLA